MKSYVNYATYVTAGLLLFGAGLYLAPTMSSFTSIASYAHKPKSLKFSKLVVVVTDAPDATSMKKCIQMLIDQSMQIDNIKTYGEDYSACHFCNKYSTGLGDPKKKGPLAAAFDCELNADTAVIVMKCDTNLHDHFIEKVVDRWTIETPVSTTAVSCHLESQL